MSFRGLFFPQAQICPFPFENRTQNPTILLVFKSKETNQKKNKSPPIHLRGSVRGRLTIGGSHLSSDEPRAVRESKRHKGERSVLLMVVLGGAVALAMVRAAQAAPDAWAKVTSGPLDEI
ncbi:hypothetical protein GQ457_17G003540 [Hibiscus cannabinus]